MSKKFSIIALLVSTSLLFIACDKDDPDIPNEEELITTINYTLMPAGGGAPITLSFQDLDGDGGDDPTITGGTLAVNQIYTGSLEVLNETESPADDITVEILAEDKDHQFFFQTSLSAVSIAYSDQDGDGNPVGLSTTLSTGGTASGDITIILRHEPNKSASGVSGGDITNAGGETDIAVTIPVDVQ